MRSMISDCVIWMRRVPGDCEGNAAAEFALLIPLLLLLIFGVYEFGRLYWIQNTLQYAAEQTGRCVMAQSSAKTGNLVSISSGTCAYSNFLPAISSASVSNGSPASAVICSGGTFTGATCQQIKLSYSVPNTDMLNVIVTKLIALATHRSQTNWSFTLTGQATVPIS